MNEWELYRDCLDKKARYLRDKLLAEELAELARRAAINRKNALKDPKFEGDLATLAIAADQRIGKKPDPDNWPYNVPTPDKIPKTALINHI